jgi:hypothetical protein
MTQRSSEVILRVLYLRVKLTALLQSCLVTYLLKFVSIQRGPKVTSLVALSSRGRCAQHLHDVRGLHDAHRTRILRVILFA